MKDLLVKIERYLFLLFLAAIPLQARIILYSPSWYFNEYLSFALYGTDILLVLLLGVWLLQERNIFSVRPVWTGYALGALMIVAGGSLLVAGNINVGAYRFLKLVEGILFFIYMHHRALTIVSLQQILWAVVGGGLLQASLGIAQFLKQSDLGLRYLGESVLGNNLRGVAVFYDKAGERVMRAYGTTPHPNILATYLMIAIGGLYVIYSKYQTKIIDWRWHIAYVLILFGFLMTFSRTVILAWVILVVTVAFFWWLQYRDTWKKMVPIGLSTVGVAILFVAIFWSSIVGRLTINPSDEAIVLRQYYNTQAAQSHASIDLGVGIGNFVPWLMKNQASLPRELYQPAHNIYLLVYAELGAIGVLVFAALIVLLIVQFFRNAPLNKERFLGVGVFACLLFIGAFDHFFWTLQQGILMWWGVAGLVAHYGKSR